MNESLSMPTITSTPTTESNLTAAAPGRPVGMYSTDVSFNQPSQPGSQDQGILKQMASTALLIYNCLC